MKYSLRILIVFSTIILITISCKDYLDVVPNNIAVIEDAFETRDNAERFLATLYGYLPNFNEVQSVALTGGDEAIVNDEVSRNWDSRRVARGGQSKVNPASSSWDLFIALRDCNIFLENIHLPFDLEDSERQRWVAEAQILKAYFHFYLMRKYGPIPIIRENIDVSEGLNAVRVTRDPVDEIVNYIVELLDEAIANNFLPDVIQDVGAEMGRLTRPIALALKARVLVTAASPLFNGNADYANFINVDGSEHLVNSSYDENKWKLAADACLAAIEAAHAQGHELYYFNRNNFPKASDSTYIKLTIRGSVTEPWNREIIWGSSNNPISATFQSYIHPNVVSGLTPEASTSTQTWYSATFRMAELYYSKNGVPIEEDVDYNYEGRYETSVGDSDHRYHIAQGESTANLNFNREPRFYASLGFDRGIWEGHGQQESEFYYLKGRLGELGGKNDLDRWSLTGYLPKKLIHYTAFQSPTQNRFTTESYPFPIIRLADLYLAYAESLNELGMSDQAIEWVNKIRERAQLDGVRESWSTFSKNPNKPDTKEGLREIIHHERLIELAFEGQRFWDLRRWKKAERLLNSAIQGWNVDGETVADYYRVVEVGRYQFSSKDYLWPIAEYDILTNPNLVQNPGW